MVEILRVLARADSVVKKLESRKAKMREDIDSLGKAGEASDEEEEEEHLITPVRGLQIKQINQSPKNKYTADFHSRPGGICGFGCVSICFIHGGSPGTEKKTLSRVDKVSTVGL